MGPGEFAVCGFEEEFSMAEKENRCAVCGHTLHYLRFHLVPSAFRTWMPSNFQPGSHDVLLLCTPCHEEATKRHTNALTGKLALQVGIDLKTQLSNKDINRAKSAAR